MIRGLLTKSGGTLATGRADPTPRTPAKSPTPGLRWGHPEAMANPRPPAVPATLHLSLEQYYAACAAVGMLSAQTAEPDQDSAVQWSVEFGAKMAAATRKAWGHK